MHFDFFKYQGTGNDFVLINNHKLSFPKENHALVRQICDRRFGIGADGLMLLEEAEGMDFKMVYYNSDGNESTMCGNGGRCICAFAAHLGIVERSGQFIAIDGPHEFSIEGDIVKLKMIDVPAIRKEMGFEGENYELFTGSPHFVSFRENIAHLDIVSEAKKIRYSQLYAKAGINVNFMEVKEGKIKMRTYERGVEDETLSCGTGTVAVALCFAETNNLEKGTVDIQTPGGDLSVSFEKRGAVYTNVWLEGPAKMVFMGTIEV